ncbi:FAD-binding oxidoreductase [Mycobacteroides chelonae]|uniref:FAD-binding oxidoreductase n=1 Tax=Mycobacteroides chelonae TaxID=1774 RepID=UPI0012FFC4FE|nr:FAD-binding oxidoreductase [Mycobacteroides chelonae]
MASTADAVSALKSELSGRVFGPGVADYAQSVRTWNGTVTYAPLVVVRAESGSDVVAAARFAESQGLGIAVRATGHGALVDVDEDAILIDTSRMKRITVDPTDRTATLQPGVNTIEFVRAIQEYGLAAPTAISPTVGMTGYTLAGGYGDMPRYFGLSSDNIVSAQVVLADGTQLSVSDTENADLLWGMRGGGGNFAIVTELTLRLKPLVTVVAGVLTYGIDNAKSVMAAVREWMTVIPDEMSVEVAYFSARATGSELASLVLTLIYLGPGEDGQPLIDELVMRTKPTSNSVHEKTFLDFFEDLDDPGFGGHNYWHGVLFDDLGPELVEQLVASVRDPESRLMLLFSFYGGGRWSERAEEFSAVSHRDGQWLMNGRAIVALGDADTARRQVADLAARLAPFNDRSVPYTYVEYEGPSRLPDVFGQAKLLRLRELKRIIDPNNRLRYNANIAP